MILEQDEAKAVANAAVGLEQFVAKAAALKAHIDAGRLMTRTPAENKFRRDYNGTPTRPAKVELEKLYEDAADKTQFNLDCVKNEYEATRAIRGREHCLVRSRRYPWRVHVVRFSC